MKCGVWVAVAGAAFLGSAAMSVKPYRAEIRSAEKALVAFEAETASVTLTIENKGSAVWISKGDAPCFVSYHILDAGKCVLRYENPRFPLPESVGPGRSVRLPVEIKAPFAAGDYQVEFDLLIEGRVWFKDEGSTTLLIPLKVAERVWPEKNLNTKIESSLPEFNDLMKLVRTTLKHDEVSFQGKSGLVEGFAAGSAYPQIWLRDANTIIPASKYFYPLPYLSSWLDEHLSLQKPDGALWDWVDSRGEVDKNTVETDQEASAVQAAAQVFRLTGKAWPARTVAGVRIADRLEKALSYVLKDRIDPATGLVTGGHTADWGDVEAEDADQNAVYLGPGSHRTLDIYDQAMFYEAALDLASILDAAGDGRTAAAWRRRADGIKAAANRRLWMADKGYYRVHIHKDPFDHAFAEDDIFAMGGNVQAALSGMADDRGLDRALRIIEKALAGQKDLGISTVSGTLLPPYPKGFFKHPAMDEAFEYQNGGQWDWFGGKLVLLMFESGFARTARDKLIEIAKKDIANGGFFEWDAKDGAARGSDFYAGSAGSLARALIEGYLGIRIDSSVFELAPRLGLDEARVHISIPATGRAVAYDYRFDTGTRALLFEFSCNDEPGPKIRILNPWPSPRPEALIGESSDMEVRFNGRKIPFRLDRVGLDEYIRLDAMTTHFLKGAVEVRLVPVTGKMSGRAR
jgi:hypothetical protein